MNNSSLEFYSSTACNTIWLESFALAAYNREPIYICLISTTSSPIDDRVVVADG